MEPRGSSAQSLPILVPSDIPPLIRASHIPAHGRVCIRGSSASALNPPLQSRSPLRSAWALPSPATSNTPLSNAFASQRQKTRLDYLLERKEQLYENLRDLSFEYKAGKYPEEDFVTQRAILENETAQLMSEIDHLQQA